MISGWKISSSNKARNENFSSVTRREIIILEKHSQECSILSNIRKPISIIEKLPSLEWIDLRVNDRASTFNWPKTIYTSLDLPKEYIFISCDIFPMQLKIEMLKKRKRRNQFI
jgi:hypothetical protein